MGIYSEKMLEKFECTKCEVEERPNVLSLDKIMCIEDMEATIKEL